MYKNFVLQNIQLKMHIFQVQTSLIQCYNPRFPRNVSSIKPHVNCPDFTAYQTFFPQHPHTQKLSNFTMRAFMWCQLFVLRFMHFHPYKISKLSLNHNNGKDLPPSQNAQLNISPHFKPTNQFNLLKLRIRLFCLFSNLNLINIGLLGKRNLIISFGLCIAWVAYVYIYIKLVRGELGYHSICSTIIHKRKLRVTLGTFSFKYMWLFSSFFRLIFFKIKNKTNEITLQYQTIICK